MIKQLGGTRGVPKPNAEVAGEALNLLTFLGGDNKAGAKMLAEMRDVQSHNQKLLDEANAAVREANRLQKGVDQSQSALEEDTARTRITFEKMSADFDKRSLALDEKKKLDDDYFLSQTRELKERTARVDTVENGFKVRDKALEKHHKDLEARERQVVEAQNIASRVRRELEERDARLRQAMGG